MSESYFSASYVEAQGRFVAAARAAGAALQAYALDAQAAQPLTIDVAILGADHHPTLVVSSGIHGVEGFFGSAVQLALLERLRDAAAYDGLRVVLIHALNPYGFAHLRRVNEDNVDLNRNFMTIADDYQGAPAGYVQLNEFLNPRSPPSRFEPFGLKALWKILRLGLQPLKEAIAGGQYEFPRGLFYGGNGPSATTRIVQQHCDAWLAASPLILHLDLHTGLGALGNHTLLLNEPANTPRYAWYAETFGADVVEPMARPGGTAYRASGPFGLWMQRHFRGSDYRFAGVEFGTYDVIRMLKIMRAENRAHHHCAPGDPTYIRTKQDLLDCFCPASPAWRKRVVDAALKIIAQATQALLVEQR